MIDYFSDYLGFSSSEPLAFTLTVVKGASPSITLENEAFPDLQTSANITLFALLLDKSSQS